MAQPMALRPTTIRFAADAHELVQRASQQVGETFSQFVREAAIMRAALLLGKDADLRQLAEEVRRLARDGD